MSVRLAALDCKVRTELKASDIEAFLAECGKSRLVVGVAVAKDDQSCGSDLESAHCGRQGQQTPGLTGHGFGKLLGAGLVIHPKTLI